MSQFDELIQRRSAAAGFSLLIGFSGSVIGLVYGWSYVFDKAWFILWFLIAACFVIVGLREWMLVSSRDDADKGAMVATAGGLTDAGVGPRASTYAAPAQTPQESRTLEQDSADHDPEAHSTAVGVVPRIEE